jgi:hypothetical protein
MSTLPKSPQIAKSARNLYNSRVIRIFQLPWQLRIHGVLLGAIMCAFVLPAINAENVIAKWDVTGRSGSDEIKDVANVRPGADAVIKDPSLVIFTNMFNAMGAWFTPENGTKAGFEHRIVCDRVDKLNIAFEDGFRVRMEAAFKENAQGVLFAKQWLENGIVTCGIYAAITPNRKEQNIGLQFMVGGEGAEGHVNACAQTPQCLVPDQLYSIEFIFTPGVKIEILIDGILKARFTKNVPKNILSNDCPFYIGSCVTRSPLSQTFIKSLEISEGEE